MKSSRIPTLSSFVLAAGALACFAGCESGSDHRAAIEEARREVPPMAATEVFFDGRVTAHLTLGSSYGAARDTDKGPGGKGSGHGGGGHGGGGGGHMHGGRHGGMGGGGMGGADAGTEGAPDVQTRLVDSPMPPAMMHLQLENTSAAALTVEIHDLNSELGNFATQPDIFTLEPKAVGEPGAMQSLLGVDSLALPVTLTLRVDGKLETKVLTLRPAPPAPAATP